MIDNFENNISTILVAIYAVLAPYIAQYMSQEVFIAICGLILVIWSAYNPNTMKIFNNDKKTPTEEYTNGLNDEYSTEEFYEK